MPDERIDLRLPSIKVADVILAALQAAFGQEKLFDDMANPYRFIRDDPSGSKVWVCDPDQRQAERDGKRMIVQVTRGEYTPNELHLMNRGQGGFSQPTDRHDLASAPIYVMCEAGLKIQSEVLASMCYSILKYFREELMAEYDIHSIRLAGISPSVKQKGTNGEPWMTTVTVKVEVGEFGKVVELGNHLNMTLIKGALDHNDARAVVSLDSPPQ